VCEAVGFSHWTTLTLSANVPLAERWSGSAWTVQTTAHPPNPEGSDMILTGVSCVRGGTCEAVGYQVFGEGTGQALAQQWNGAKWVSQTPTNPNGEVPAFYSVSCSSSTACEAVGNNTAESWNGTTWLVQQTATPSGDQDTELWGVSCLATGRCDAVGSTFNGSMLEMTLSEVLNGGTWTDQATPVPTGSRAGAQTNLASVACASPNACEAVGSGISAGSSTYFGIAYRWNGSHWSSQGLS
jgi:hypothetical protein